MILTEGQHRSCEQSANATEFGGVFCRGKILSGSGWLNVSVRADLSQLIVTSLDAKRILMSGS